jgi:hypothetical protein
MYVICFYKFYQFKNLGKIETNLILNYQETKILINLVNLNNYHLQNTVFSKYIKTFDIRISSELKTILKILERIEENFP